ncbi:hypothetical protein [Actinomyces dentalis]|uniref:hypothetical protein n=1 Tax=Actinomyces dentalis TaxID=272548 RepID=UPI002354A9EA|nr:hypothetical protein [Actinomyces dentalis]
MTAGPPSGGRPPLTDAKPLVFTGIHSRAGMRVIVFSMVMLVMIPVGILHPLSLRERFDDGLDSGMIMLLIQTIPLVIGGLIGIVFILHHRQRLCVDAGGFLIRTGRRSRTLGWDQVRGNLAVAVIPQHARSPIGIKFNLKPLLLPVITVEGERIELPCLMGDPYYERQPHQRMERAMAAIAARDPGPGAGAVAPPRPDELVLTEHRDDKGAAFILLGSACSCWGLAWHLMNDYDLDIRYIFAGVLVALGLAVMMLALCAPFFRMRPDDTTVVDASGLEVRRGWRRRSLSWEQVRGHLKARAIPPNGKGGLSRGGTWNWGWRAQVHYRDGERDVPLAGASLMAWDEASALQLARERIDLLRSYDPDPTAAPAHPPAVPPVYPPAAPPAQYGTPAPQSYSPAAPAPSDDSWREPGLYGRPASAWEIMTSPAGTDPHERRPDSTQ